jgi:Protein of unknown function (DUF3501)
MRKLTVDDIVDLRAYERERDEFRSRVIAVKKARRVPLGDLMTMLFENFDTMRFQIQEMARAERMLRDEQIEQEVAMYNELLPNEGQLSATLFVEITDPDGLREWLPKLVGLQNHLSIEVAGSVSPASEIDEERLTREEEITTTVHYLRFNFTPDQRATFREGPVTVRVDHPAYRAETALDDDQRAALADDLQE